MSRVLNHDEPFRETLYSLEAETDSGPKPTKLMDSTICLPSPRPLQSRQDPTRTRGISRHRYCYQHCLCASHYVLLATSIVRRSTSTAMSVGPLHLCIQHSFDYINLHRGVGNSPLISDPSFEPVLSEGCKGVFSFVV